MRLLACAFVLSVSLVYGFQAPSPDLATQARSELYAARNDYAATLYQKLVEQDPARGDAYYGLVRALLRAHKAHDAYAAAAQGLEKAPQTSGAQVAAGMAAFRRGELGKAEDYYRTAYKINPKDPGALVGMASLFSMGSKFKAARELLLEAYRDSPGDPDLMTVRADSLKGAAHIAALEKVMAIYDPETDEARALKARVAIDRSVGDRKLNRLTSPYQSTRLKLFEIMHSPKVARGLGVRVQFNQRDSARLMLDLGSPDISLSPKLAEKFGLEVLGHDSYEAKGIGDGRSQDALRYLASELKIGEMTMENCPVSVYRAAETADHDGTIGLGLFRQFMVSVDFLNTELVIEPRTSGNAAASDEPEDAENQPPPGFHRIMRFNDEVAIPTSVNENPPKLFLLDPGGQVNLIDEDEARVSAGGSRYTRAVIGGIQGRVDKASVSDHVSLGFAGIRYDAPRLIAINFDKISDTAGVQVTGILGLPVLRHFKLTIDYRNGAVRFEH